MSLQSRLLFTAIIITCFTQSFNLYSQTFSVTEHPKNLGSPVNSEKNDFTPTVSPDGRFMIFNSNRNGAYQDLFISYFKDGAWSKPEPLSGLNSPYNDETPFLSADGTILLFSSDRDGSIEMPKNNLNQIKVSFDIYWSQRVNGGWSTPEPIPGQGNTMYHEHTA